MKLKGEGGCGKGRQGLWGAVCKKIIWNKFVTFFPYLEIIKTATSRDETGAPNDNKIQNHLNIALFNVF